jgi:hypothetical protein
MPQHVADRIDPDKRAWHSRSDPPPCWRSSELRCRLQSTNLTTLPRTPFVDPVPDCFRYGLTIMLRRALCFFRSTSRTAKPP